MKRLMDILVTSFLFFSVTYRVNNSMVFGIDKGGRQSDLKHR